MPRTGRPKGQPKTGGRAKGTTNKITQSVRDAMRQAFDEVGGVSYLVKVGRDDPRTFCALLNKLIPQEISAKLAGFDGGPIQVITAVPLPDPEPEIRAIPDA